MAALPNQEKSLVCLFCRSLSMVLRRGRKLWEKMKANLGVNHTPRYLITCDSHLKGLLSLTVFNLDSGSEIFIASDFQ